MTTSEESDVVVLHRGGNTSSTDAEITPVPQKENIHETLPSILSPSQIRHAGGKVTSSVQQNIRQKVTPASRKNFPTGNEPLQEASPTSSKEEALEELSRLRAQIVRQAHLDRFKDLDYPTANPEILERCRSGPGTDPNSEFYLSIKKCRVAPIQSAGVPCITGLTSGSIHETIKLSVSGADEVAAQWGDYESSPTVYPIVKDRELNLSSEPTDEHKRILSQLAQTSGLQGGTGGQNTESEQERKHSWTDIYYANWEYYPHACSSSYEAFRDWFRRWLDGTIQICCYADIYHYAFFDGTAHPDGIRTMYIPDLEEQTTLLDMDDKESLLHCHETVLGYCHNWELHNKKERDEEQLRRKITREHYLEGLRNSPQPSASVLQENVYLRPVEMGDVPGLLEIFNWYAHNSPLSTYIEPLEAGDIRQCIDDCTEEKLPFIVAAERRIRATANNNPQKILGYALATDYIGRRTSGRFTAELELFVKPGHTHKGIGKCLMDKLLEVCDPTYIPKRGYFFDCNTEDRTGYWSGGQRRLGRLLFAISYPSDKRSTYSWVEEWLKRQYDFEEQGRLKGARVKFSHFLNVTYLVRNVGHHAGDKFDS
ncbi:hypothetical protein BDV32DRAFT_140570 [Aspergillus pseudonomiae]|uniref:Uncharacterized protein n=1 Tax=Aspergillus pseudonomiae TaxID=1506151 RepID=A0A5N6HUG0_9EURO|nr:uncharacterized protein BDV37DRAFT_295009 [Aspergillus pseudonomiae]KAB8257269.1 hypothetical protein BDV32DRAFT_140570 [Aspergillus pseudonomiae]KAE8402739.1 hypothetical protein BDV37DRAFT_295009 [Aspergillus pseudonomiae]